jgi:hypothetical protein
MSFFFTSIMPNLSMDKVASVSHDMSIHRTMFIERMDNPWSNALQLSRRASVDGNQGAGYADHTHGNGAEVAQDPLSLPSGPITRLRAKRFKEALNGLIQENWADSKKTKMGSNNNQGLVHVIKAIEEDN